MSKVDNDKNNDQSQLDRINENIINNNNQQQPQFEDLGFLSNDYHNSFTLSLNGFLNAMDNYKTAIYKCGVFADILIILSKKIKDFQNVLLTLMVIVLNLPILQ